MVFPERFSDLPEYTFARLRRLLDAHEAGGPVVHMSIGEPKHPFPGWVPGLVSEHAEDFSRYPPNDGTPRLLEAIAGWLERRFSARLDPQTQIMALNGSREGLFSACLALCPERTPDGRQSAVLLPNPFYQVYAVAARAAGAEPVFVPATEATNFLPDYRALDPETLDRVAVAYLCSPSNPQGAVAGRDWLKDLLELAETHDFRIFSDECYSEIYRDAPPPGILEIAAELGTDPERALAFNSLSKRSNLPGLRSGFVAGGPECIRRIRQLRSYAGAPLPGPLQRAAERLWADEAHVDENRALYAAKYALADAAFAGVPGYRSPQAGFFLWLKVGDGEKAALKLWRETGIRALPGSYLGREVNGENPAREYLRVALTAPAEEIGEALPRLRDCLYG